MIDPTRLISTSLLLMLVFWVSYFWTRTRLPKQVRLNHVTFLLNLIFIVAIFLGYQVWLLKTLDIYSTGLAITTLIMVAAALMHHISILLHYKGHLWVRRIHGPISHSLFFVPFGINAGFTGRALAGSAVSFVDIVWVSIFLIVTIGGSVAGVLVGLQKLKLPYK